MSDDSIEVAEADVWLAILELDHLDHHVEHLRRIVRRSALAKTGAEQLLDVIAGVVGQLRQGLSQ